MRSIASLLHGKGIFAMSFPGSGDPVFFQESDCQFVDLPKKGTRTNLFLSPSDSDLLVWKVSDLPRKQKEQQAYFRWVAARELMLKDPVVCWDFFSEQKVLLLGCEKQILSEWLQRIGHYGLKPVRVDSLFTPAINSAVGIGSDVLVALVHDYTMLAGISHGKPLFIRKFITGSQGELENEISTTLSCYEFTPQKKLVFTFGSNTFSDGINLSKAQELGRFINEEI